ncbi:hypothetical protein [Chryseobacterium koreense]|uniref:Uncharacterized protein n=1 Tax=Chryseobacterium koreense CCUG 49689 TaxID=1304281 RepID=A0A0J7LN75_9FLAO|nr:hypothetical protein [Chryseobacterium koreense]KMQ70540.1 hypothetical protein ACM44_11485 [Chryseobacterium koreense CCUG 49689]MBB5334340.1 hypothetical protein [Chryseobacterium koreense]
MNYTVVGLFPSQENAKKVSASLEHAGFKNEDYIIYRTDRENTPEERKNFWERLFGTAQNEAEKIEAEKLITSVQVQNEEELEDAKKTFAQNDAVNIYEFKDMTIEEAKNLSYIKKIVELRAKSQIYAIPEISLSSGNINEGINAEVKA